jgi:WbqC-like protein family
VTCLAVMQPTVLPWSGYFNLISKCDVFIFHDDVQLEKRSWQTRNRLIFEKKEAWITMPIKHDGESQKINGTSVLADQKWRLSNIQKFKRNYERHPYYQEGYEVFEKYINTQTINLAVRNEELIKFVCKKLKLNKQFYTASNLKIDGVRSDKLIKLCDLFKATKYLSPIGSREYLEIDNFVDKTKTKLEFQEYLPNPYPQKGMDNFVSYLSIVDVICNLGFAGARLYVARN